MLCGGVGTAKTFSSDPMAMAGEADGLPIASVEAVDPIALHLKRVDTAQCLPRAAAAGYTGLHPQPLRRQHSHADTAKRLYVKLGQFTIVRLERDTQLLIPAYDYCVPDKDCPAAAARTIPCASSRRYASPWRILPPGLRRGGHLNSAVRGAPEKAIRQPVAGGFCVCRGAYCTP